MIPDELGSERNPLEFQIETNLANSRLLFRGLPRGPAEFTGVCRGEGEQVGQRRRGIRIEPAPSGEEAGHGRYRRVLIGKSYRVGIPRGAVATHFGERKFADRESRGVLDGVSQDRIMKEDRHAVPGEMDVRLDRRNSKIERDLEGGECVFGLKATGAAVTLEVKTG
jgi:hypothetical protein